jgi:hypothetical protein
MTPNHMPTTSARSRVTRCRQMAIEQLEDRAVLAFTASLVAGDLLFEGTAGHDRLINVYAAGTPPTIHFDTDSGDWTLGTPTLPLTPRFPCPVPELL